MLAGRLGERGDALLGMTPRLVHVEWVDAFSVDPWTSTDAIDIKLPTIQTVGFVVRESDDVLAVAGSFDEDHDDACCVMVIPRAMIQKIRDLAAGEEINLSAG